MTKILHGYIRRKKDGWSFQLGKDYDRAVICRGLPSVDIAYEKMTESQINPKVRLLPLVATNGGMIEYKLYKLMEV